MPTYADSTAAGHVVLRGQAKGSDHCCGGGIQLKVKLEAVHPLFTPACGPGAGGRAAGTGTVALSPELIARLKSSGATRSGVRGQVPVLALADPPYRGGRCVATLAVGPTGRAWLAETGGAMLAYARRIGAEFRVLGEDADDGDSYPLRLKWRLAELLAEYDRVAFLDADAVVGPDCPDLFAAVPPDRLGLWDDLPRLQRKDWVPREAEAIRAAAGLPDRGPIETCYNSGVIVASRCHRSLFVPPAVPVPHYHCTEQHWLNLMVREHSPAIHPLPMELHWHPHSAAGGPTGYDGTWPAGTHVVHLVGIVGRAARLRDVVRTLYPTGVEPLPPCRHRGDQAQAGAVAAAGLSTSRAWFRCERPGFTRQSLLVVGCEGCGLPVGRRCGPGLCGGYEPAAD